MVDLCPTNEKLVTRATRIIATAAHISEGRAAELLAASGGKPKVAIVSALTGCSLAEGQQRLAAAGGFVRKALQQGDEVNI
jgi:N-acetylmuramic acid 6-phosphate etherase